MDRSPPLPLVLECDQFLPSFTIVKSVLRRPSLYPYMEESRGVVIHQPIPLPADFMGACVLAQSTYWSKASGVIIHHPLFPLTVVEGSTIHLSLLQHGRERLGFNDPPLPSPTWEERLGSITTLLHHSGKSRSMMTHQPLTPRNRLRELDCWIGTEIEQKKNGVSER